MNVHDLPEETREYLGKIGYCGLFADRETVAEAQEYLNDVATACGKGNSVAVITAAHVLLNTVILHYLKHGIITVPAATEEVSDGQ